MCKYYKEATRKTLSFPNNCDTHHLCCQGADLEITFIIHVKSHENIHKIIVKQNDWNLSAA